MATMGRVFDQSTAGSSVAEMFSSAIKGKTILITGINKGGLGGKMVEILSAHSPKILILASRTPSKIQDIINTWQAISPSATYIPVAVDLGSQDSVREAASAILNNPEIERIDLVFNNAAVMRLQERVLSSEGIEMQFATNHIGHFLLTNLIMPKIVAAAKTSPEGATRIVNVSSRGVGYSPVRFSDINFDRPFESLPENEQPGKERVAATGWPVDPKQSYHQLVAYGQSKSANVLFSFSLTSKLYKRHGILSFGVHPGTIITELARNLDPQEWKDLSEKFKDNFVSPDQGCATSLRAGLDDSLGPAKEDGSGIYMADTEIADAPAWAQDPKLAEQLWTLSEKLVGQSFEL